MKKKSKLIFTIFLAMVLLYLAVYTTMNIYFTSQINNEIKNIQAQKEPLTLQDIAPEKIKPEENAAYFYHAAIDCASYNNFNASAFNHKPEILIKEVRKNQVKVNKSLEENKMIFEMLKMGYEKPKCRYDLRYYEGINMRLLNYIGCRGIALGAAYKAVNYINENKPEKAVEILAQGFRFTRSIRTQNALLECMIRIAMEAILRVPLEYLAEKNIKTNYNPVLNEINAILNLNEQKNDLAESLMAERTLVLDVYNHPLKYYASPFGETNATKLLFLSYYTLFKPVFKADMLCFLQYYAHIIKDIDTGKKPSLDPDKFIKKYYIISLIMIPNTSKAFEQHEKSLNALKELKQKLEKLNTM